MEDRPRLGWAVGASSALHLLALLLLSHMPAPTAIVPPPHLELIPIALLGNPGGGDGGGTAPAATETPSLPAAPASPPAAVAPPAPVAPPRPAPSPHPPKPVVNRPKTAPKPPPAVASLPPRHDEAAHATSSPRAPGDAASASVGGHGSGTEGAGSGAGAAGSGGGHGGGVGGGEGSGDARVAYAANPRPEYPLIARRMGMEGVVLLGVLVRSDGSVGDVEVQQSSGFAQLDDAAVRTVRSRWRFIPARKGGAPIDARVTVPIRFRLSDES